jgi:hypothetical protein
VSAIVLASSRLIQEFPGSYSPEIESILAERSPMKRAIYERKVGILREAPSLVRLSLFAVNNLIAKEHSSNDKVIPPY